MIAAWAWLRRRAWLIVSGVGGLLSLLFLCWLRRPAEQGQVPDQPRAEQEREQDAKAEAIREAAAAQIRALRLRAITERARQEAARRVREQAIRRRALEADPDTLRQELLDASQKILEGRDEE